MAQIKRILNTYTQKREEAELSVDSNGEIVASFRDGNILKFPNGTSPEEFDRLVEQHNKSNQGQRPIERVEIKNYGERKGKK